MDASRMTAHAAETIVRPLHAPRSARVDPGGSLALDAGSSSRALDRPRDESAGPAFDPTEAAARLAAEFGMETVDLTARTIPEDVLALVSREFALRHGLIPYERTKSILRVALSDPVQTDGVDVLGHLLRLTIEPRIAPAAQVAEAISRHYGEVEDASQRLTRDLDREIRRVSAPDVVARAEAPQPDPVDAPVVKLAHALIVEAIQRRASDIHLEPLEKRFRVRYRIDGVLHEAESPSKRLQLAIISRLKIMANISIAEKRIPQNGRIQVMVANRALDLRVSTLPTAHGESIVMRILDKEGLKLGLAELGFLPDDQATFERLSGSPDGLLLVTGPTGSGKTTTLYGCLHHLNQPQHKIITVEDPVEYQLSGINQVPVRPEVGVTFASALRAILRQAPNVVMIGEIRDFETAEIAVSAALTGHMVFSTLHTNDAPGAVIRLVDLGVKPYLVSGALRGVMAQRLVRKICENCRQPYTPTSAELSLLNLDQSALATAKFCRGAGCPACHRTGYRGRIGIFELFEVTESLQRMIHEHAGASRLRESARAAGMRTMRADGIRKATAGLTTIEEVVSITVGDSA